MSAMSHWILTHTGREHFITGAEVLSNVVDISDIAWSLAQINRFTGHANRPYSVAEHSLLVADLAAADNCTPLVQMLGLMHDAHECITGDVSSPVKIGVGLNWARFETLQADRVRRSLRLASGFAAYRQVVNVYDLVALATERRDITSFDPARNLPWAVLDTPGAEIRPAADINLNSLERVNRSWAGWRDAFLVRYVALQAQVRAAADAASVQYRTV